MPDSQKHRPGVQVKESPVKRVEQMLKEAAETEKQIEIFRMSKNEESEAKQRRVLCESLSDILLTNPKVANEADCPTRLWNFCFYKTVNQMRSRLRKAEKQRNSAELNDYKRRMRVFLKDALTLYDYLIGVYHEKLCPDSSQMEGDTQESQFSVLEPGSLEGVIENLFKFYIHIGDLYRYSENFTKAEQSYMNAAKLAPGKGNAYNQLAVVAQMKDANMSCVALYWYTRSIMATHQSFPTSTSNLDKLFETNAAYLENHSRDDVPPILNLENKKKVAQDIIRAQKQAAGRSCLAHFVDAHFRIYRLPVDKIDESKEFELSAKIKAISRSLQSICRYSAFSDSLLCKMVAVNAFTYEVNKDKQFAKHHISREFLFVTGASLSEPLETVMSKIVEKDKISNPAIRLLLPFQILCEFVLNLDGNEGREEEAFWKRFVEIGNLALKIAQKLGITANSFQVESGVSVPLKEYQLLQGYKPFQFLFGNYSFGECYINAEDAIDVLDLTLSQSQESTSNADESRTKLARFLEICNLCANKKNIPVFHSDVDGLVFGYEVLEDAGISQSKSGDQHMDEDAPPIKVQSPVDNGFHQIPEEEDDAGDVVVYKAPETGGGPALLVPGALLANTATTAADKSTPASVNKPNEHGVGSSERTQIPNMPLPPTPASESIQMTAASAESTSVPPPPGLLPPPGFTAPIAGTPHGASLSPMPSPMMAQGIPPLQGIAPPQAVYGQVMHPNVIAGVSNTAPSYGAFPAGTVPLQGMAAPTQGQAVPFGQPWQLFGGPESLRTANPFAGPLPARYGNTKPSNSYYDDQPINPEGISLLDSALIDSLFMDDTKTKNPWHG